MIAHYDYKLTQNKPIIPCDGVEQYLIIRPAKIPGEPIITWAGQYYLVNGGLCILYIRAPLQARDKGLTQP